MTSILKIHFAAMLFGAVHLAAAPFQNLNFEQANTNSLSPGLPGEAYGAVSDLLPGWQLLRDGESLTIMGFNYSGFPFPNVPTLFNAVSGGIEPIEGLYSLRLTRNIGSVEFSLSQTGDIPADARFLTFTYRGLPFVASINGENVTPEFFEPLARAPRTVMAEISRFSGQTATLTFRTTDVIPGMPNIGDSEIDSIAFVVPEPSTYALLALGAAALAGRWLWRRKRQQ